MSPFRPAWESLVRAALAEDLGRGDRTTEAVVPAGLRGRAEILAREPLVLSGLEPAACCFALLGAALRPRAGEGDRVPEGGVLAEVEGPVRAILSAERTALDFLMHLCGIATHTARVVAAAPRLRIVDTRKTTPGLRVLEKAAVRHGGAANHRFGLDDGILIKENHLRAAGGVAAAVAAARRAAHHLLRVQVEVETLEELEAAIAAGADAVLLDNMDDATLARAVERAAGRVLLEASGGMTPERLARLQDLGLDQVSVGGLVHRARWVDLSLQLVEPAGPTWV